MREVGVSPAGTLQAVQPGPAQDRPVLEVLVRSRGGRRQLLVGAAALIGPLVIGLVFPHPMARPVVPLAIMLMIPIALAMTDGLAFSLLAAASATASVWYFNFPPGYSFTLENAEDAEAIAAMAFIAVVTATLVSVLRDRQMRQAIRSVEQEQSIAALQRALLPERVPSTSGIDIGWHYRTGGAPGAPVGGDWLAFVPLDLSSLGVAIGDVAGHGLDAVAAMAEYRFGLRVLATQHREPHVVADQLEALVLLFGRATFSSCIYGVIDVANQTWVYSNAGHCPPVLLRGGTAQPLPEIGGPVIGMRPAPHPYTESTLTLKAEDVLVLYTDGLVERRDELIDVGIQRLAERVLSLDTRDLDQQASSIVDDLAGATPEDDVAIMLIHIRGH
jgi:serine phosphatase RsbU (regulator of sigma subunit)